jgi:hypothetical protein
MLAHFPRLLLIIDHLHRDYEIPGEAQEGIALALRHRDRVHCVCLELRVPNLQKAHHDHSL